MNKKLGLLFSSIVLLALPLVTLAQELTPTQWFEGIITRFLAIIVWPIFVSAIIIMLVYAGFLFVTAQGDPSKITSAKHAVIWAVVGIIVGILAYSAYGIIKSIIAP